MSRQTNTNYFFAGVLVAAIASPFGMVATILAPVFLFSFKEFYLNYVGKIASPTNLVWANTGVVFVAAILRLTSLKI